MRTTRVFDAHVRSVPQVISAYNIAGESDYLLSIVARDVAELQHVLNGLTAKGGSRLVTSLVLEEVKPPSPLPLGHAVPAAAR
jgi:DNA-binding Lrp family transcriptional regulator